MKKLILTAVVFCFAFAANVGAESCHFGKDCKNGQKAVAEQKTEKVKTFKKSSKGYSHKKAAKEGKKCGCDKAKYTRKCSKMAKEGKACPCAKEAKEGCPFAAQKAMEEATPCQCGKDAKDCKCGKALGAEKGCGCAKAAKEGKDCPYAKEGEGCPLAAQKGMEAGKPCQCGKDAKDCQCGKALGAEKGCGCGKELKD